MCPPRTLHERLISFEVKCALVSASASKNMLSGTPGASVYGEAYLSAFALN